MKYLFADFESRGIVELQGKNSVGLYNYWAHPQTQALMFAYGLGDISLTPLDMKIWRLWLGEPMPHDLEDYLADERIPLVAFNSAFERLGLKKLGHELPISRFEDPQVSARYLSLPPDLETVGDILGLPFNLAKQKRGAELIKLFSIPVIKKAKKPTKKNPEGVPGRIYFNDWNSHPTEWEEWCEYCKQDCVAEREILRREQLLGAFPMPELERRLWIFDQKVNDRGIPVNRQFVTNGLALAQRAKAAAKQAGCEFTGLENFNSRDQLLPWLQARGYEDDTLEKDAVTTALKFSTTLTPEARKALKMRQSAASTTFQKLAAVLRQICPDDRLRGQFIFMGSARCGRWSGNAVQMHNMARPVPLFEDEAVVEEARNLIFGMNYDGIIDHYKTDEKQGLVRREAPQMLDEERDYGAVLLTIKNVIRTIFETKPGKRFNVCDLNAIETRMAGYMCQCGDLIAVFVPRPGKKNGLDPYLAFASKMTGISYEDLDAALHSKDPLVKATAKRHRQIAKPAVLGAVYRLKGGGIVIIWKTGRKGKDGLWDYAEKMGVDMSQEQANDAVRAFRASYPEIVKGWYDLERLVMEVLQGGPKTTRTWGPNGIYKFDKLVINDRGATRNILRLQLPSGRYLHYFDARVENRKKGWKDREGKDVYKPTIVYANIDQETHLWGETETHGGKILENLDQGSSRDVLAVKLLMFEEAGLPVVGHVHDEGITETDDDPLSPGLPEMDAIMRMPIDFLPGFILGCDGFEDHYYHK